MTTCCCIRRSSLPAAVQILHMRVVSVAITVFPVRARKDAFDGQARRKFVPARDCLSRSGACGTRQFGFNLGLLRRPRTCL